MQHSDFVLALNTLALVAFEECNFEYTAIAVVFGYGNTPMRLHTHMNDHSFISGIITGGDYVGGAFFVEERGLLWEGGGVPAIATNDGRQVRGSLQDVSRGVKFDSHALPGPWPGDGTRIALVYYSRAAAQEVTSEEQQHMRQMGFPIRATSVCNTLICVDVRLILKRQKCGARFSFCNVCDNGHPHMMMDILISMRMWHHHISSHYHSTKCVTLSCFCDFFVFLSFCSEIVQGEINTKG